MIKLTRYKGETVFLNENEISSIQDTGPSSKWHGINTIITMNNGNVFELSDRINQIEEKLNG